MRGFLAALAASGALSFGAAAEAATISTPIGGLFFEHDPAVWNAEAAEDTALISCVSETCAFIEIEVFFAPNDDRCDERVALAAAEGAFPGMTSRAVNMLAIGPFAVYFAESHVATTVYDPTIGDAVYACFDRDRIRYEFLSRIGDDPVPPSNESYVHAVLTALRAPPAPVEMLRIGGLVLAHRTDQWTLPSAQTAAGPTMINCLPPHCDGVVPLTIGVEPFADPTLPCMTNDDGTRLTVHEAARIEITTIPIAKGQLTMEFATIDSMCRAWTPPQYGACVIYDGARYSFWTGWDTGCHFGPAISEDAFLGLVQSLRPVTAP